MCDPERLVASCTSCEHHAHGTAVPELVSGYSVAAVPQAFASTPDLSARDLSVRDLDATQEASPTPRAPKGARLDP